MTPATSVAQTRPAFATAVDHATPPGITHPLRRVARSAAEVFGAMGIALFAPLAILAVGIPIALVARGVLWVLGAL